MDNSYEKYNDTTPIHQYNSDLYIVEFPKSGITWMSHILVNVFLLQNKSTFRASYYNLEMFVGDIHINKDIVKMDELPFRMIKFHSPYNPHYRHMLYLIRNPFDVMRSYYSFTMQKMLNNYSEIDDIAIDDPIFIGKYTYNALELLESTINSIGAYKSHMIGYIGAFGSFGKNATIGMNHPIDEIDTRGFPWHEAFSGKNQRAEMMQKYNKKVYIKNDVWIGRNVTILNGITIGNGAIIGANSVVTHDVPDYSVMAGIPAKIIRYRFDEDIIKQLLKIKWWNWPNELIKKHSEFFKFPDQFMMLIEDSELLSEVGYLRNY